MKKIIVLSIKLYQKIISPFVGPACRFLPSCSDYTCQAVQKYGAFKGSFLGLKRIARCHPFHPGGFDPIP